MPEHTPKKTIALTAGTMRAIVGFRTMVPEPSRGEILPNCYKGVK
jgi:hypothetical protein